MHIIVAITGASGAPYAVRLIQALAEKKCKVHVTISAAGARLLKHEMGVNIDLQNFSVKSLLGKTTTKVAYYHHDYISAPIASGTFPIDAMAVIPCSMS
ncbi:MAG: hypothetical protein HY801_01570, partial [Candidatus Lindowbacteria bacterium]|nr:hypothetical protein [Candidatus Lindowbacteria bacterium]